MTKAESRALDQRAAESFSLSASQLMDNAGLKAKQELLKLFPDRRTFKIFCGPGHNGGDGLSLAFYLQKAGLKPDIYLTETNNPLFQEKKHRLMASSSGSKLKKWEEWKAEGGEVLVDALFGVGLSRPLKGQSKELSLKIQAVSNGGVPVVALDLPSGLCADTGKALGPAIKADFTLSFALAKPGFYLEDGPALCGKVKVLPIGFPQKLLTELCSSVERVETADGAKHIPSYKDSASKMDRGRALICAGREGMWGCGLLAARAAYIAGSGFVHWAGEDYPYKKSLEIPEAILSRYTDKNLFKNQKAVGAGPGIGFSPSAKKLLSRLKLLNIPTVLDADALTLLSREKTLSSLGSNFLLTPHAGEMSRLLGCSQEEVERDRLLAARLAAQKYSCRVLLKGFYPILSDGRKSWILPFGNSALGKAGSGDALTGILVGLLAQGLSLFQASLLAVILQGETAEQWLKEGKDRNSFSSSEIINGLPSALLHLRLPDYQ